MFTITWSDYWLDANFLCASSDNCPWWAQPWRSEEAAFMCAQSEVLIWGALWGEPDRNGGRETTSDQINCQTTKPVGGSRLSERLVPEIYAGFQGCRADAYQARCKFRSALLQIYDSCFSLSSRPLSLPPKGATGVGDEGCGMISHRMRIPAWSFKPPWLWQRRQQCCLRSPAWISLQLITKIFIAIVLASFLSSSLCCCAQSLLFTILGILFLIS